MSMLVPSSLHRVITNTIRGAFMADAASMGTHWIYNPKDVLDKIRNINEPEFVNPPVPNYYSSIEFPNHYEYGMLSPYGEQLLFVTQYTAKHTTSNSELIGNDMSMAMYEWATTFGGRPDHALTTMIDNIKNNKMYPNCGADDDQAHIYMKIVPITCRYINDTTTSTTNRSTKLIEKVAEIIRVHQNNDTAVAFGIVAARILESVMLLSSSNVASPMMTSATLLQALDDCYDSIDNDLEMIFGIGEKSELIDAVRTAYQRAKTAATEFTTLDALLLQLSHEKMKDQPDSPFYDFAGRSCALPASFIGPLYQLYKVALSSPPTATTITENVYIDAIRENILAAGDTCSRGVFLGAVLAAATAGEKKIPTFESLWQQVEEKTRTEIQLYADQIAATHLKATDDTPKNEL